MAASSYLTDTPLNGLAHTDTGLAAGITHTYAVSSVDAGGDESVPSATAAVSFTGTQNQESSSPAEGGRMLCVFSRVGQWTGTE